MQWAARAVRKTASAVSARSFPGKRFVKGFNHLEAAAPAAALAERLGYAPVSLGTLAGGGPMTQTRGDSWSPLDFQDLVTFD
jgi:predicted dinucleotide-binding enzyme